MSPDAALRASTRIRRGGRARPLAVSAIGVLAVAGALAPNLAGPRGRVEAQVINVYLDGEYHGPYRGRVVDAETGAPLPDTVVVAIWRREIVYPFQTNTVAYRVRETLTKEDGTFLLEARDIEEAAPRRTFRPALLFFKSGYSVFKGWNDFKFEGAGTTLPLRRLASWDERRRTGNDVSPHELSEDASTDLPELLRAVNAERRLRGLSPFPPKVEKLQ
jgi:hypothetical protein